MADIHQPNAAVHGAGEAHTVHHETKDINLGGVLVFAIGLVLVGLFIHFGVWLLLVFFQGRETAAQPTPAYPLAITRETKLPPEPRLQTNPREDLRELRDSEDAILNSYGWVDRNAGVVHIPIGEAMKRIVERGLPARARN
jgi:hypothetical protein